MQVIKIEGYDIEQGRSYLEFDPQVFMFPELTTEL